MICGRLRFRFRITFGIDSKTGEHSITLMALKIAFQSLVEICTITIATDHKQDVINTILIKLRSYTPAESDSPSIDAISQYHIGYGNIFTILLALSTGKGRFGVLSRLQ